MNFNTLFLKKCQPILNLLKMGFLCMNILCISHIQSLEIVNLPKIIGYDLHNKTLTMERIPSDCISNIYGENDEDVDGEIYNKIRKIIKRLYENDIEYPDITGYNFIEYQNKLWIIDFEHRKILRRNKKR